MNVMKRIHYSPNKMFVVLAALGFLLSSCMFTVDPGEKAVSIAARRIALLRPEFGPAQQFPRGFSKSEEITLADGGSGQFYVHSQPDAAGRYLKIVTSSLERRHYRVQIYFEFGKNYEAFSGGLRTGMFFVVDLDEESIQKSGTLE